MKNKKVLFATTNPAKVNKYKEGLKSRAIDLITINDLNLNIKVDENGKNAIENAIIKAKAYFDATRIPTIGMDNSLFIENLPEEKQPGTHVRRVNGKSLTDDEMIEYYTNLVRENGDKLIAKWVYGLAICNEKGTDTISWNKSDFYFVETPHEIRNPGYPLDSISITVDTGKYFVELTKEEKEKNNKKDGVDSYTEKVIDFIAKNI